MSSKIVCPRWQHQKKRGSETALVDRFGFRLELGWLAGFQALLYLGDRVAHAVSVAPLMEGPLVLTHEAVQLLAVLLAEVDVHVSPFRLVRHLVGYLSRLQKIEPYLFGDGGANR